MKKLFFLPLLALLFLGFASCDDDDVSPAIPFTAEYDVTVEVLSFDDQTGTMEAKLTATGTATELGTSTWVSDPTTVYNTFSAHPWYQDGNQTFTAEDGATLIGSFEGKSYPVGEGQGGDGTFLITGGTGEYEGYTGSGTYYWEPTDQPTNYLKFEGQLIKPD